MDPVLSLSPECSKCFSPAIWLMLENPTGMKLVMALYALIKNLYRQKLEDNGAMSAVQTYHSAQCICDLGMNDSRLCTWTSCGICSILKSGFESFEFGARSNSGR
jgi:hypothetical protein